MVSAGSELTSNMRSLRPGLHRVVPIAIGRLVQVVSVLVAVSILTFVILSAIPGSVIDARIGPLPTFSPEEREEIVASLTKQLGLDQPLWKQYVLWLRQVIQGDLGYTYQGLRVTDLIAQRFGPTVELGLVSVIGGLFGSLIVSLIAFRTRFQFIRGGIQGVMTLLLVMPAFWLGLILVLMIAVKFDFLPSGGFEAFGDGIFNHIKFLVLPAVTLALPLIALFFRYLYSGLRDTENLPFIVASRARGLSERSVVYRHILPNAILPTITVVGLVVGSVISGLVIVETVFSWPGLGSLLVKSVEVQDYGTVSAIVLITAALYVITAFFVDVLYEIVDPRTRRRL